jgi:hypothetical protein
LRASGTWVRLISLRNSTTAIESVSVPRYSTARRESVGSPSSRARNFSTSSLARTRGYTTSARSGPVPSGVNPAGSRPASLRRNCSRASWLTCSADSVLPAAADSSTAIDGSSGRSSRCCPLSANSRVIRPSSTALTPATAFSGLRRLTASAWRQASPSTSRSTSADSWSTCRSPSRSVRRARRSS